MSAVDRPVLHGLCGRIAAGKSTLAARLVAAPRTVSLSEDALLSTLYPGEIRTIDDFGRCSARLRAAIAPHVRALLAGGTSVVLDFHANTRVARGWLRSMVATGEAALVVHWLDVPDEVCKARLRARNAAGTHAYETSEAEYELFTRHFVPPGPDEGLDVVVHR